MRSSAAGLGIVLAIACGRPVTTAEPMQSGLKSGAAEEVGSVTAREHGQRIQLRVQVNGLPPGLHGMHLHEVGRCEGPAFQSAGGHLNPSALMRHGRRNPQGPHLGDLGNIRVADDRRADVTVEVAGAEARIGLRTFLGLGQGGLALVIHANLDDEVTDPSGNSGARIACAVLQ